MDSIERVSVEFLCVLLLDKFQPISERFRAFSSHVAIKHTPVMNAFIKAMRDDSTLLAFVAAYELGRMQKPDAIPALEAVLKDLSLRPIVRLKAAESLGAFGLETSIPVLETSFQSDPSREVRDTCELALTRIRELKNAETNDKTKLVYFGALEPAPPMFRPIPELREILLNNDNSLYERCSALFGLRHFCSRKHYTEEALLAIIESLLDVESAILRHHVAYCLYQIGNKKAFHALSQVLRNVFEHPLVRLEAADALRSIAVNEGLGSTTCCECIELLMEFAKDPEPIVSQSCEVALRRLDFLGTESFFGFMLTPDQRIQRESAKRTNEGMIC